VSGLPFDGVAAILILPAATAALLALLPGYRLSAAINVASSLATFVAAISFLFSKPASSDYFLVDDLNIVFVVLNTFVAFTSSVFSASYIAHELEIGRLTRRHLRFYHAMYQTLLFAMNLALVANNIGLMWVAIEMATLTTVAMVGIYRTPEAIEAAWKYFILGSVGIALALFGTILVYMAARPVMGEGIDGMVWTKLIARVGEFEPALLNLAFVFLMLGYGTKVGLAPLHAWLPDAHAEGPTPISAVLSGLLLNVALYAVLRFKLLLDANAGAIAPGPLMATLGIVSLIFAAFMLYRRRDIKRLFAFSSIEHMGIIVFAFGMGGPLANFAGLLHMTMHSLTKSAIFFTVGHIAQAKGTQKIADIRGLTVSHPALGWSLVVGVFAIAGLPPLGIFTSEFLVVSSTFARQPWLALLLVLGLLLAFGALILRLQGMAFGEPSPGDRRSTASSLPIAAHLGLVLVAGLYLPPPLVAWFQHVAAMLR
jgi:hydrogenase-4 component F